MSLLQRFTNDYNYEMGLDEAGRGPLFGRLYVAATVLPKGNDFHHEWMKDSKRFHSDKKIREIHKCKKKFRVIEVIKVISARISSDLCHKSQLRKK